MYGFELITMSDCFKNIKDVILVSKPNIIICTKIFINQTIT